MSEGPRVKPAGLNLPPFKLERCNALTYGVVVIFVGIVLPLYSSPIPMVCWHNMWNKQHTWGRGLSPQPHPFFKTNNFETLNKNDILYG